MRDESRDKQMNEPCDLCGKSYDSEDLFCPHCGHDPGLGKECRCSGCYEAKIDRADNAIKALKEGGFKIVGLTELIYGKTQEHLK